VKNLNKKNNSSIKYICNDYIDVKSEISVIEQSTPKSIIKILIESSPSKLTNNLIKHNGLKGSELLASKLSKTKFDSFNNTWNGLSKLNDDTEQKAQQKHKQKQCFEFNKQFSTDKSLFNDEMKINNIKSEKSIRKTRTNELDESKLIQKLSCMHKINTTLKSQLTDIEDQRALKYALAKHTKTIKSQVQLNPQERSHNPVQGSFDD